MSKIGPRGPLDDKCPDMLDLNLQISDWPCQLPVVETDILLADVVSFNMLICFNYSWCVKHGQTILSAGLKPINTAPYGVLVKCHPSLPSHGRISSQTTPAAHLARHVRLTPDTASQGSIQEWLGTMLGSNLPSLLKHTLNLWYIYIYVANPATTKWMVTIIAKRSVYYWLEVTTLIHHGCVIEKLACNEIPSERKIWVE